MENVYSLSLSSLVKELMLTDVILSVSGPPITLAVFMLPQSAVMEVVPKRNDTALYHQFAISLNLFHYTHYQVEASYFEKDENGDYEAFVDGIALWIYFQDLYNMVLHNKFHMSYVYSNQTV